MPTLSLELSPAAQDVLLERERQIKVEGWSDNHDDEHRNGELAKAAAAYARHAAAYAAFNPAIGLEAYRAVERDRVGFPWPAKWWKPKDPRRDLVRAGALILAEIERLDRAAAKSST